MKSLRKNNNGAALILVICCMAILSVVGSLLLIKTTNNRDMKEKERKAQETFYKAETGSMEFTSALEAICQDAIKKSFSDLMIEYTKFTGDASGTAGKKRAQRFGDMFKSVLTTKLKSDGAAKILKDALGKDVLDVSVEFKSSDVQVITNAATNKTDTIKIKDVVFSYKDSKGDNTFIKTDILIAADIPDIEKGMMAGACADFYDFALICGGGVKPTSGGNGVKEITGNVFVEKDFVVDKDTKNLTVYNADKFLVKGNMIIGTVTKGVNTGGGEIKFVNNTGNTGTGRGIWANNIFVGASGSLTATAMNVYVADDLSISGQGPKVTLSGTEYIGYNGGVFNKSEKNSAITINYAKDMVLDMSGMGSLVLRGSSYIEDKAWKMGAAAEGVEKTLGILQGESLAYKDMQAMYLVPSECTPLGQNPALKEQFMDLNAEQKAAILSYDISDKFDSNSFPLSKYLNATEPYEKRYVVLDGGGTEFVYLYLNFKGTAEAKQFYEDYMKTSRGAKIREQIKNLEASTIKLAAENFTLSNMLQYVEDASGNRVLKTLTNSGSYGIMSSRSRTAAQNFTGLFTFFRLDRYLPYPDGYDVIKEAVLSDKITNVLNGNKSESKNMSCTFKTESGVTTTLACTFYAYSGNTTTTALAAAGLNNKKGIILIDGNLTNDTTTFNFEGLVLATGDVSLNSINLKANQNLVIEMLEDPDVAKYFKGQGAKGAQSGGNYVSTDSVSISFENWNRN